MKSTSTRSSARGRPRDPALDDAILRVVYERLTSQGYDRLRVDEVAATAGVSLTTIYRRWRTKGDLVAASLARASTLASPPDDDAGLRGFLERSSALVRLNPEFLPGIVVAIREQPQLADALRDGLRRPDHDQVADLLRSRIGPGVDDEMVRLLVDVGPAVVFMRALLENEPPTTATLDRIERLIEFAIDALTPDPDASDRPR
ncbi:MAG: TetR/AcrR family transcriptional regulator [Dermatophilaceae bacterium]